MPLVNSGSTPPASLEQRIHELEAERLDLTTALAALRRSVVAFRNLAESDIIGILFFTLDGRVSEANHMFWAMLGLADQEETRDSLSLNDITLPEYHDSNAQAIEQLRERGVTAPWETVYRHADGRHIPALVVAALLKGSLDTALAFVLNLAEHHAADEVRMRLAAIVESSRYGIIGKTLDGIITSWNRGAEQLYGYTASEAIGQPITMIVPADRRNEMPAIMERLAQGEQIENFETVRRTKDGRLIDVDISISPIINSAGQIIGAAKIAQDITERKRSEEAQRILASASAVLAASLDMTATLRTVARLAVPFLGDLCVIDLVQSNNEIFRAATHTLHPTHGKLEQFLPWLLPPERQSLHPIARVLRSGQPEYWPDLEMENATPDPLLNATPYIVVPLAARGRTFGALSYIASDPHRRFTQADLALATDLAYRAALATDNARLYNAERQARQIAEQAAHRIARLQDVTAALSTALTPEHVARAVIEQGVVALGAQAGLLALLTKQDALHPLYMMGYRPSFIEGVNWQTMPLATPSPITDAARTGLPIWIESPGSFVERYPQLVADLQPGGGAWAALPLLAEGRVVGAIGFGFAQAHTFQADDRAFIQALAQQSAQAIERARLYETEQQAHIDAQAAIHTRDEFLSVAAHELKTPITSLRGFTQVLLHLFETNSAIDPSRMQRALQVIDKQSDKLTTLVDQLLDISRIEAGKLTLDRQAIDLGALLEPIVTAAQAQTTKHSIQLRGAQEQAISLVVDPLRLEQVLTNLLSNAIRYSPDGGLIVVDVTRPTTDTLSISVTDQGLGIPPEHRAHIFDRFYQAHTGHGHYRSGMGLGLYISKQIIDLHNGTLHAEFPREGGTRMILTLPADAGHLAVITQPID